MYFILTSLFVFLSAFAASAQEMVIDEDGNEISWSDFQKYMKIETLEGKLKWIFPAKTKYLCPSDDQVGISFDPQSETRNRKFGLTTLEFLEEGKILSMDFVPKNKSPLLWDWVQKTEYPDWAYARPVKLTYLPRNHEFLSNHIILIQNLSCSEPDYSFDEYSQYPEQICLRIFGHLFDTSESYILNCYKTDP